jgi:hypothetical protein
VSTIPALALHCALLLPAVNILYLRGRGNPVQAIAARWFLVAERGAVRFDEVVPGPAASLKLTG